MKLTKQSIWSMVGVLMLAGWYDHNLAGMFEAAGWQVITVKYGRRLESLRRYHAQSGGETNAKNPHAPLT